MKNLFLIPTESPSRLHLIDDSLMITDGYKNSVCDAEVNIYITSDEEIKEGDYMYDIDGDVGKAIGSDMKEFEGNKKIILTTDQNLDGVRKINDTFLEWFVKNPSCEEVEIEIEPMFPMYSTFIEHIDNPPFYGNLKRKIIIPKEEAKDVVLGYKTSLVAQMLDKVEPKKETLEEAALRLYPKVITDPYNLSEDLLKEERTIFIDGAKWQQERMYSEAIEFGKWLDENTQQREYYPMSAMTMEELFEQFKKK